MEKNDVTKWFFKVILTSMNDMIQGEIFGWVIYLFCYIFNYIIEICIVIYVCSFARVFIAVFYWFFEKLK